MPHIIVKMYPGRRSSRRPASRGLSSKMLWRSLTWVMTLCRSRSRKPKQTWAEKVYKPDIVNGSGKLYKKPGYDPLR